MGLSSPMMAVLFLLDQTINLVIIAQRLQQRAQKSHSIVNHWRNLTEPNQEVVNPTILQVVMEAQKLMKMDKNAESVNFHNVIGLGCREKLPDGPKSQWVSSFYHIYRSLVFSYSNGQPDNYFIRTHFKLNKNTATLVFSLLDQSLKNRSFQSFNHSQEKEFVLANKLLQSYGQQFEKLPSLRGPIPIAIRWVSIVETKKKNSKPTADFPAELS